MKSGSKKKQPKISVIIPTYNRAYLIGRAIKSVLNQTYQDFEIIVVDDGSTDNTEKVVKSFNNAKISYIRHEKNRGEAAARNTGIKAAKNEYIAFQDSDDESFSQRLEKQVIIFEEESQKIGLVYSDMISIDEKGKKHYVKPAEFTPKDKFIYKKALNYERVCIGIGTSLIRKNCFEVAGFFDEKIPYFVDAEFFIRLSKYFYFYHISEPLINFYRMNYDSDENLNRSLKNLIISRKLILKKYFSDIKKDREILANHYLGLCISLYENNEYEEAKKYSQYLAKIYNYTNKDKKILSNHLYFIGNYLCSKGNFSEGRKYLVRAVKKYPANIVALLKAFISLFGKDVFTIIFKIYHNTLMKSK